MATLDNGVLKYKQFFKEQELPVSDIAWSYLQNVSGATKVCCGGYGYEYWKLILYSKEGKKLTVQFSDDKAVHKLFEELKAANPEMACGFTEENKERFKEMIKN